MTNRYEDFDLQHLLRHTPFPGPQNEDVRLTDLLRVLKHRRKVVFWCAFAGTILSIVVALLMTPVYRAQVILSPVGEDAGATGIGGARLGGVAELVGVRMPGAPEVSKADEAVALLLSRQFTQRFLQDEGLLPILAPNDDEARSFLFQLVGTAQERSNAESTDTLDQSKLIWNAYKRFNSIRSISKDRETGLITLAIEWTDPLLATNWANKLVKKLNTEQRANAILESEKNLAYLSEQLDRTSGNEMRRLLINLIEGQTKNIMLANSQEETSFKVLDPAVVPHEKVRPKRLLIVALGIFTGVLFGILYAFLSNFSTHRGRSRVDS